MADNTDQIIHIGGHFYVQSRSDSSSNSRADQFQFGNRCTTAPIPTCSASGDVFRDKVLTVGSVGSACVTTTVSLPPPLSETLPADHPECAVAMIRLQQALAASRYADAIDELELFMTRRWIGPRMQAVSACISASKPTGGYGRLDRPMGHAAESRACFDGMWRACQLHYNESK